MESDQVVVGSGQLGFGYGLEGQRNLVRALSEEGFDVVPIRDEWWPRDRYVYAADRIVTEKAFEFIGDGGFYRLGDDYLLVGDALADFVINNHSCIRHMRSEGERDAAYAALAERVIESFPGMRVHVLPTGVVDGVGNNHLDMSVLLLPRTGLILVDTHYGRRAAESDIVDVVAELEGLRVRRYDGNEDGVQYSLNALVLPRDSGEIAFVNAGAKSLSHLLRDAGVSVREVVVPQAEVSAGGIHCMTNTLPSTYVLETLFQREFPYVFAAIPS